MACWLVNLGLVAITTVVACCTLFASAADIDTIDITVLLHAGSSPADASISQQPTTLLSAIHSTDRPLGSDASEAALLFGSLPKAFSADACSRWQGSEQLFDVSLTQAARPGRQQSWPKGLMIRRVTGCDSDSSMLGVHAEATLSSGLNLKVFCLPYSESCQVFITGSSIDRLKASSSQPNLAHSSCGHDEAGDGVTCTVLGPVSAEGCEQLQPWLQPHCQPGMLGVRVWPATPDSFVSLLPELVAASPAPEHVPVGSRSGFLRSSGGDNAWTAHLRARRLLQ